MQGKDSRGDSEAQHTMVDIICLDDDTDSSCVVVELRRPPESVQNTCCNQDYIKLYDLRVVRAAQVFRRKGDMTVRGCPAPAKSTILIRIRGAQGCADHRLVGPSLNNSRISPACAQGFCLQGARGKAEPPFPDRDFSKSHLFDHPLH